MDDDKKKVWFVYIASLLTPFTFLLSGIIGIIYAGYQLDKDQESEMINSHYYGLIRSFFLYLTFFVVLIVTVATANGILVGVNNYWYQNTWIDTVSHIIPIIGGILALVAIVIWLVRVIQGMKRLKQDLPHNPEQEGIKI